MGINYIEVDFLQKASIKNWLKLVEGAACLSYFIFNWINLLLPC